MSLHTSGDPAAPVEKLCKGALAESCGCKGVRSLVRKEAPRWPVTAMGVKNLRPGVF